MPFKFQAPVVELRILEEMIKKAPAAFPKILSLGKWLDKITDTDVAVMRQQVLDKVGGMLDSRLATQYALTIMCAEKVSTYFRAIILEQPTQILLIRDRAHKSLVAPRHYYNMQL